MGDENKNIMTKEDLVKMMKDVSSEGVTTQLKEALAAFKIENDKATEKQIFSFKEGLVDDGYRKTFMGSEINTLALAKTFSNPRASQMSNNEFGATVLGNGGLFTKLSPAMESFGKLLKGKLNAGNLGNMDFDVSKHKEMCLTQLKAQGMNEAVGADGGFLVPVEYSSTMIEFAIQMSKILSKVWRVPMNSLTSKWPRLAQTDDSFFGGFQVHWINEAAAKEKEKPALEQLTFTAHKAAKIIPLTDELIEDSLLNIVNYCMALGVRSWMYELERVVIDGTGVGQPLGITNDPIVIANAIARQTAGTVTFDDLINLESAMNENFRDLSWIMRRKTLGALRKQKDTNGQPMWTESWQTVNGTQTMVPNIIGYPYDITRNAPEIQHRGALVLGDLGMYMLAVRKDMKVEVSNIPYWTTDETAIRFVARVDGKPGSSYAFKMLAGTGS
jgi:HK97 family phage major capsid protein